LVSDNFLLDLKVLES